MLNIKLNIPLILVAKVIPKVDRLTEQHGEPKGDDSHEALVKIDGFLGFVLNFAFGVS